jgi:hypothetical protein
MNDRRSKLPHLISEEETHWQRLAVRLAKLRGARDEESRPFEQVHLDEVINQTVALQAAIESYVGALEVEMLGTPFLAPLLASQKKERKLDLYFCYVREDEPFLDALQKRLPPVFRTGATGWDGREAPEGAATLETARFIVVLVSEDFLTSDRLYEELLIAMGRREMEEALVLPIIVRACDWSKAPFARLHVLPKGGDPIDDAPDRNAVLADIARYLGALFTGN